MTEVSFYERVRDAFAAEIGADKLPRYAGEGAGARYAGPMDTELGTIAPFAVDHASALSDAGWTTIVDLTANQLARDFRCFLVENPGIQWLDLPTIAYSTRSDNGASLLLAWIGHSIKTVS